MNKLTAIDNTVLKNVHPALLDVITEMIVASKLSMTFYGHLALYVNFKKHDNIPTAGVRFTTNGMEFVYNNKFISELSHKELRFTMIHEMMHLICDHQYRADKWNADKEIANIVMDQIINTEILRNYKNDVEYPDPNNNGFRLLIPPEYKGDEIWELLYDWVKDLKETHKDKFKKYENKICDNILDNVKKQLNQNNDDNSGEDEHPNNDDANESNNDISEWLDNEIENDFPNKSKEFKDTIKALAGRGTKFDEHLENEVNDELAKHQIDKAINSCKNRGLIGDYEERLLSKLRKRKTDYTNSIKKATQFLKSSMKNSTFVRPNRKHIPGLKGKYNRQINAINCIIDTSGSMEADIELMMSYIFKNDLYINLIQIDTEVKSVIQITNMQDFKNIKLKGFGGTVLQPAIDYITNNNKLKLYNTILLTDGYTDTLDLTGMKSVVILTCGRECPISGHPRNLKQINIDRTND